MRKLTLGLVITLLVSAWASAQFTQQGNKLVGALAAGAAQQGWSVAISADGNTAIVGGNHDNANAGAAWVFTRGGGVWSQQGSKLVGTGAVGAAQQGWSVAISADGNTAIIGGPADNGATGAAWVFTRSGGTWAQQGNKLVGANASPGGERGGSVALSADGNTAIIGNTNYNDLSQYVVGRLWVFTRSGGVWTQQGPELFPGQSCDCPTPQDWVGEGGFAVALSADGNTALVGNPWLGPDDAGDIGGAWVYKRSAGVWAQQMNLLWDVPALFGGPTTAPYLDQQGWSVALSADGNTAIIGGPQHSQNTGAAFVFLNSGGVWAQQGPRLVGALAVGAAEQGWSVALSSDGNTAIVGGMDDNYPSGAAWVFARSAGVWTQQGSKLVGALAAGGARQGYSVALSADGKTAIIGGPTDNGSTGAVWIFVAGGCTPPSITAQPQSTTIVSGQTATLSVAASGTGPLSYQWYLGSSGNTSQPVGTNASTFTTPALTATTSYWARVSNACGHADSATATITVVPPLTITTPSTLPAGALGVAYSVQLAASGGAGGNQWRLVRGSPPGGITVYSTGLVAGTPTTTGDFSFTVSVTDAASNTTEGTFSMHVSGCTSPSITAQAQSQSIQSGQSATLSVTATGGTPLAYQWYQGFSGDTSHPVGTNVSSFATPALSVTTSFWVRVSNSCGHADSATATITVTAGNCTLSGAASIPSPYELKGVDSWVTPGGKRFALAGGLGGLDIIDMQGEKVVQTIAGQNSWQAVGDGDGRVYLASDSSGLWVYQVGEATQAPSFVASAQTAGRTFGLSWLAPNQVLAAAADTAGLEIYQVDSGGTPTRVTTYPTQAPSWAVASDGGLVASASTNFGLELWSYAGGTSLTHRGSLALAGTAYDVELSGGFAYVSAYDAGVHVVDVHNPDSPVLKATLRPSVGGGSYYFFDAAVKGSYLAVVGSTTALAGLATLYDISNPTAPVQLAQASPAYTVAVTFAGAQLVVGEDTAGVMIFDMPGCWACTPPAITAQPQSQSIQSGQTATLSVTATGDTPLSYQWYLGSSGNTSHPVGTNASSYTTPALTTTTSYWVRVSNACDHADSATATVSITASLRKAGDCNGDGTVSITELQQVITNQLGITSTGCGDCDGNGVVSITEVQMAVNCQLGLASCTATCVH